MKKKLLSILIVVILCILSSNIELFVNADTTDTNNLSDLWGYTENDDCTLTIIYYDGKESNLTVPNQINGKDVTIIGQEAFSHDIYIKSLKLPNTLQKIKNGAFLSTSLEYVEISESVELLDAYSFANCKNLETVVILSSNLELNVGCYPLKLMPFANDTNLTIYYPKDSMTEEQLFLYDWSFGENCNFIAINDLIGDMDCDGSLTYVDLLLLKRYILRDSYLNINADVNQDGNINILDMLELKNLIEKC